MMAASRGAARPTLLAYGKDLAHLGAFLAPTPLATATADQLGAYMRALGRGGTSPATSARRRSALRQFYRFLVEGGGAATIRRHGSMRHAAAGRFRSCWGRTKPQRCWRRRAPPATMRRRAG